jgi:hypothetical protein
MLLYSIAFDTALVCVLTCHSPPKNAWSCTLTPSTLTELRRRDSFALKSNNINSHTYRILVCRILESDQLVVRERDGFGEIGSKDGGWIRLARDTLAGSCVNGVVSLRVT